MAKAMTKSQIVDHLATKSGVTKKTASEILDNMAEVPGCQGCERFHPGQKVNFGKVLRARWGNRLFCGQRVG